MDSGGGFDAGHVHSAGCGHHVHGPDCGHSHSHAADSAIGWFGFMDDTGDHHRSGGASAKSRGFGTTLALSGAGGIAGGLLIDNKVVSLLASLAAGAAMPYAVMHKPQAVEIVGSAALAGIADLVTQNSKRNWRARVEADRKAAAMEQPEPENGEKKAALAR